MAKGRGFYNHSEISMIALNTSELMCSIRIFYLHLNKEIHTPPETQDWAQLGLYFCFTLKCLC